MAWILKVPERIVDAGPPPRPTEILPCYADRPTCDHTEKEVRHDRTEKVGTRFRLQCVRCGRGFGLVGKSKVNSFLGMKDFDYDLQNRWEDSLKRYYQDFDRQQKITREVQDQEWQEWYGRYLKSEKWRTIRARVFERDSNLCQGCRVAPAVAVHHLTYIHVGDEFIWELVSVCQRCHDRWHELGPQDR